APGDLLSNATNFYGIRHGVNRTGAAFLYFGYSSTSVSGVDAVSRDQFWNCGNRGFSSPGEHFSCLASTGSYRILSPREGNTVGFGSAVALIGDPSRYRSLTNDPIEINNDPLLPYQYYSDSNGDGYADIVISAPSTAVSGKSQVGTLWQFFGNPRNVNLYEVGDLYNVKSPNAPLATDDYTINFPSCDGFTSTAKRSRCAPSLLRSNSMASGTTIGATEAQFAVGDITGDGLKDLVVGAPGETTIGAGSGAVLVYTSLKNAGLTSAYKKFYGTETSANDGLGTAVTTGNFNGDFNIFAGNPAYPTINPMYDVFAGAPFDGFGAPAVGAVLGFVSSGLPLPSTMSSTSNGFGSPLSLRETQASFQEYGLRAARIVGDLNGDGYEDAITRETFYHADGSRQTDVIVYYGSELGLITVQFCLNNKDKIFLAENAPNSDCYPWVVPNRGLTKNDMSLPQKISRPLNLPTDWFQIAFRAGDINNDGFADVLLVGQPAGGTDSFVVYYGARGGLQNVVDPSYTPSVGDPQIVMQKSALRATSHYDSHLETERFVSGDFNGDGFSDLAIGMPFMPSPPMNTPSAPYLPRSGSGVSS
ncbi:MAG TPA: FG-GAP repeat protein, partial [Pseudobdellovibrionaceae bacterium]|nr:FG-GAP repeat protein [Pseudobdellovibrionaceae bacterium]